MTTTATRPVEGEVGLVTGETAGPGRPLAGGAIADPAALADRLSNTEHTVFHARAYQIALGFATR